MGQHVMLKLPYIGIVTMTMDKTQRFICLGSSGQEWENPLHQHPVDNPGPLTKGLVSKPKVSFMFSYWIVEEQITLSLLVVVPVTNTGTFEV